MKRLSDEEQGLIFEQYLGEVVSEQGQGDQSVDPSKLHPTHPDFRLPPLPFEEEDESMNALRNLFLGEKVPINFLDKQTQEVLIPAFTKLTFSRLRLLLQLWRSGQKFDMSFEEPYASDENVKTRVIQKILKALMPKYSMRRMKSG